MATRIGPTLTPELVAAGVSLDGLAWDAATGTVIASASAAQLAAAVAVVAAHNPSAPDPARTVDGNYFLAGLVDLGWLAFFEAAAAASTKQLDVRRYRNIDKRTPVLVSDAKLGRIAKAAAVLALQATPAIPGITLSAAVDHALAMQAAGR